MCATPVFPPSLSAAPSPDDQAAPVAADLCVAASAEPLSEASSFPALTLRWRGVEPYETSFDAMRAFTDERDSETADEIWLVEHPPVFTLGQAGNPAHLLAADSGIPLVKVDRGGQITYHGPGQVVAYLLLDLRRRKLMVRELVTRIEQAVIDTLAAYNLAGERRAGAPGIYVAPGPDVGPHAGAKIAALVFTFALVGVPLGIKVSRRETSANLGIAVVLALAYYLVIVAVGMLDHHPELHPELLLWVPNLVLFCLGIWLLRRLDRA